MRGLCFQCWFCLCSYIVKGITGPLNLISQIHFKQNWIYVVSNVTGRHIHYVNWLLLAVYWDNTHSFPLMWLAAFVCLPKIKAVGFPQNIKLLPNVEGQRNLNINISDRSVSVSVEHLQHIANYGSSQVLSISGEKKTRRHQFQGSTRKGDWDLLLV